MVINPQCHRHRIQKLVIERGSQGIEMQDGSRRLWAHWSIHEIVADLSGRSDHHDLVLKELSAPVIGAPNRWVENLPERPRRIRVGRAESNLVSTQISRNCVGAAEFL